MEKEFYALLKEEGKELDYDRVEVTFNPNSIGVMEIDREGYNLYGETYYNVYDAYDRLVLIGAL